MRCANCDAEIKDGSIYCSVCGREAQIIDSYDSLEDDFLHSLLREEIQPLKKKNKKVLSAEEQQNLQKKRRKRMMIISILLIAVVLTTGIAVKLIFDYKNNNSYDYQMKMAQRELENYNYENALNYYARALAIVPNDIESRLEMAKLYDMQEAYDSAVVLLTEAIRLDKNEAEAYSYLIDIYDKRGQYKEIQKLAEYTNEKEIQKLFADYLVSAPTIYPEGDTFYSELDVTIVSIEKYDIYYTTDGSDPITNGKRYINGIDIKLENSGLYTIRAVCKNEKNIYSDVVKQAYQIVLMQEEDTELPEEDTELPEGADLFRRNTTRGMD